MKFLVLIKGFFHKDLCLYLIFCVAVILLWCLVYRQLATMLFGLLLACYEVVLFIVLLKFFLFFM